MAKPKYASLTAELITRGMQVRRVRIIGPDGQFADAWQPIETNIAVPACAHCGSALLA